MAQILKPTNMAMHYSQDLDSRKTRIDMNFSSLVLNVSPNSIQILLNSYNTFMTNMQVQDIVEDEPKKKVVIEDNLWKTTDIKEEEHWYLKPDGCYEADKYDAQSLASTCLSEYGDEQMIFKIQQLIVILEYGRGNNTVPLVLVESKVNGELRNWSYRMCVKMNLELEAAYYNSTVALWEPVIERLCVEQQNGLPYTYRWKLDIQYINNSKNDFNSAILSPNFDEADGLRRMDSIFHSIFQKCYLQ
jgi:vacuolar protein sorting-associated protein 13A/C